MPFEPSYYSDRALVLRAQRGERAAFDSLARRHRGVLIRDAGARLPDAAVADDVVQAALHHAWRRLDTLRDPGTFVSWVKAILLNECRMWHQQHRHAGETTDAADALPTIVQDIDAYLLNQETRIEVLQAIAQLPAENRHVLLLSMLEDLPYQEIAQRLGLPLNTVEDRIKRARQQLQHALRSHGIPAITSTRPPSTIPYSTVDITSDIPRLIRQLTHGLLDERRAAAIYLGHLRAPAAVNALLEALDDQDVPLQQAAVYALGRIKDPRAILPLLTHASYDLSPVQTRADAVLRQYDSVVLEPVLYTAIRASDPALRAAAAGYCGGVISRRLSAALMQAVDDADITVRLAALAALPAHLAVMPAHQVTRLFGLLRDPAPTIQAAVLTLLGQSRYRQSQEVIAALNAAMPHSEDVLREAAVATLRTVTDLQDNSALLTMLQHDPSDYIRCLAAEALPATLEAPQRAVLIAQLTTPSLSCRVAAIFALGRQHAPDIVDHLLPLLQAPEPTIREATACALAAIGDPRAIPPLLDTLLEEMQRTTVPELDAASGVIAALNAALHRFELDAVPTWIAALDPQHPPPRRLAALVLLRHFPEARLEETLITLLDDADPAIRLAVLQVWHAHARESRVEPVLPLLSPFFPLPMVRRTTRLPAIVPPLLRCLRDASAEMRQAALLVLMTYGDEQAIPALLAQLDAAGDIDTRLALLRALGKIGDQQVLPRILAAVEHADDGELRLALLRVVAALRDGSGLPALIAAAEHDASPQVRELAIQMLRDLGDSRAIPLLISLLTHDTHDVVRECAAWSLMLLRDARAVPALIERLRDPVEWTRSAAAIALGALGDQRAIAPLAEVLREPEAQALYGIRSRFQSRCAQALIALGDPRGCTALRALMPSPDSWTRIGYEEALTSCDVPDACDLHRELCDEWVAVGGSRRPRYLPAILALAARDDPQATMLLIHFVAGTSGYTWGMPPWWMAKLGRCETDLMRQAVGILRRTTNPECQAALAAHFVHQRDQDPLPPSAVLLAEVVVHCGVADGHVLLEQALRSSQASIRHQALRALEACLPDERPGLPTHLGTLTTHADPITRILAGHALLVREDTRGMPPLVAAYGDRREDHLWMLAATKLSESLTPALRQALGETALVPQALRDVQSPIIAERIGAVLVLSAGGDPRGREALAAALHDPASRVREAALAGISRFGDDALADEVMALLRDPSPRIREAACHALGALGERWALTALTRLLDQETATRVIDAAEAAICKLSAPVAVS
jgi:RNA polymerase sigma factor (sigma-70 family)